MRKIFLFLIISVSLVFNSCNDGDSSDKVKVLEITKKNLEGTWKVTKVYSEEGKISGDFNSTTLGTFPLSGLPIEIIGKDYNMTITFDDVISSLGSFIGKVEILTPVGNQKFNEKIEKLPAQGGWSVKDKTLISKTAKINIITYSPTKVVFSYPLNDGFKGSLESNGITNGTIDGELIIELTK